MYKTLLMIAVLASAVAAQTSLQRMVDAEHAFARNAAEHGTKAAFLAAMTDDAVVFAPEKVNARANWMSKGESKGLLSWAPNYADISSDGALGYTTGNWEFRPKGKGDTPVAFGDFITIWKRQPNGVYKWTIDIGTSHDRPASYSTDWKTSDVARDKKISGSSLADVAAQFMRIAGQKGLAAAYQRFASDNIRANRQGKAPILGKVAAIAEATSDAGSIAIASTQPGMASDLGYYLSEYSRTLANGKAESGFMLQVWKFYRGKWHLELDIFNPVPAK